ncbi:hypothetical protein [Neolewinella persica]|uniref:hypothetical protein n=1 Tax=Neolewinella persica TaxID=70998 RepID=UPI000372036A|nr:hypothetical protein [Neolewinella persica]
MRYVTAVIIGFLASSMLQGQLSHEYVLAREDFVTINPASLNGVYMDLPLYKFYQLVNINWQGRYLGGQQFSRHAGIRYQDRSDTWHYALTLESERLHVHDRHQLTLAIGQVDGKDYKKDDRKAISFGGSFHAGWNDTRIGDLRYGQPNDPNQFLSSSSASLGLSAGVFGFHNENNIIRYFGASASANSDTRYSEETYHFYGLGGIGRRFSDVLSIDVSIWTRYTHVSRPRGIFVPSANVPVSLNSSLRVVHSLKPDRKYTGAVGTSISGGWYGKEYFRFRISGFFLKANQKKSFTVSSPSQFGFAYEKDYLDNGLQFGDTYHLVIISPLGIPFFSDDGHGNPNLMQSIPGDSGYNSPKYQKRKNRLSKKRPDG